MLKLPPDQAETNRPKKGPVLADHTAVKIHALFGRMIQLETLLKALRQPFLSGRGAAWKCGCHVAVTISFLALPVFTVRLRPHEEAPARSPHRGFD